MQYILERFFKCKTYFCFISISVSYYGNKYNCKRNYALNGLLLTTTNHFLAFIKDELILNIKIWSPEFNKKFSCLKNKLSDSLEKHKYVFAYYKLQVLLLKNRSKVHVF